ncbi:MAG: hypothetical protein WAL90_03910 [Desulfobacterales bacterium]
MKSSRCLLFIFLGVALSLWVGCTHLGDIPSASMAESGQVTLVWKTVAGATGYAVFMSTSAGVNRLNGYRFATDGNSITISALSPGRTYYFIVTAFGAAGDIGTSKEMSYQAVAQEVGLVEFGNISAGNPPATTAVEPARPPGPAKPVTVAWQSVPGASSYNLYWRNQSGVTRKNGQKIANVKNPHTITGWKSGLTYYFVITAVNQEGESQESGEMSYTVP